MLKQGLPYILLILVYCNFDKKKVSNTFPLIEKIHWYDYYQILEIPFAFISNLERYCVQKNLFCEQTHKNNNAGYYKIKANNVKDILKYVPNTKIKKDFPFIWWDSHLNQRKSRGLKELINGYKDYSTILNIIYYLQKKYSDYIQIQKLGKSHQNKEIIVVHLTDHKSNNPYKIPLYFNALHHGNELLSVEYVLDMIFLLLGETYLENIPMKDFKEELLLEIPYETRKSFLDTLDIYIIPIVNPDGLENFWYQSIMSGRKNARNVDLNRNYPFYWNSGVYSASSFDEKAYNFKGRLYGSEKEVQSIMKFLLKYPCSFGISYHTFANKVIYPYSIDHVWNPIPDRAYYFGKIILRNSQSFRKQNYILTRKIYSVDGTDQDWIYNQTGCITYVVEGSMNLPIYEIAKWSILGIRRIWYNLLEIAKKEKRIELEFYEKDSIIKPDITILNMKFFENEQFLFYKNRWIFYLGPLNHLKLNLKYKDINTVIELHCSNICREKIYLTELYQQKW